METTVTYKDCNGKKVTKTFSSADELITRLSVEAKGYNLKRKATKELNERLRLLNAEIGLRKIIKHYSPENEDRQHKHNSYEIR